MGNAVSWAHPSLTESESLGMGPRNLGFSNPGNSSCTLNLRTTRAPVPNLFGTRGQFHGRQFFQGQDGGCMIQAVMQVLESDGEGQMKLRSLSHCLPPAVQPSS